MNDTENQIGQASEWVERGFGVAMATVIGAWGSSPRKVGSQLVVNDQEEFEGSVSGGCIESTVITEAQFVAHQNKSKTISIGIDDRQAWDFGLACGGNIEIYLEPVTPWKDILKAVNEHLSNQIPCCLITNLLNGSKYLVSADSSVSEVGLESEIFLSAQSVISKGQSRKLKTENDEYFLHALLPASQIIIGGAVHIAQPLVSMAQLLEYHCTIIDPRTAYTTQKRFPGTNLVVEHPKTALNRIKLHSNSAVVILSHSPQFDDPLLVGAMNSDAFYIGALGSKQTHAKRLERLKNEGFTDQQLSRIHGPIGLKIGSINPAEIALSIVAEITLVRRNTLIK